MNKQSNAGDDTHMPAWWMSVQRNMVISSQKAQGLEPDGEPCPLGFESNSETSAAASAPGGQQEEDAYKQEEKEKPCGFMCRMKKGMSSAKSKTSEVVSKNPEISQSSITKNAKDKEELQNAIKQADLERKAADIRL